MKDKVINIINILKEKLSIKKLIAVILVGFILYQCISTVVLTEKALSREKLIKSDKSAEIISAPLSGEAYINWLKAGGKQTEIDSNSNKITAIELQNVASSHSYIILLHPLTAQAEDMASIAYHFYDLGFNVLLPRYLSDEITYGINEKNKLLDCVKYVREKDADAKIYILGIGIGAATALLASGSETENEINGIIADSCYMSVEELFKENVKLFEVSDFPKTLLSSAYIKLFKSWSYEQGDIREAVKKTKIPVLYIHGSDDDITPIGHSNELFEVTKSEGTDHVRIHNAEHGQCLNKESEKYFREIEDFIRKTMD